MAELRPVPLAVLATRMFRELGRRDAIFDLPRRRFFLGNPERDLSVCFHGRRAATPFGPAAGPHSQMAQNIVLCWLGGARIIELKTVQVDDELHVPRPCIDMQTVGYNVEWSQELRLEQSLEEYVKGAMLIEMLVASGALALQPGCEHTIHDISVGYDLAGIRSERVQTFLRGMQDCSAVIDRLRAEIPTELAHLRDLDYRARLSDSVTLSTFHGCPPDEVERIVAALMEENGLHCVVKLNPMLLGPHAARELLNEVLGYEDVRVPDSAFERDTTWKQAVVLCDRLSSKADALGLGFGVKLTNTLIVENRRDFFPPDQKEMYLSGPPLHVLALHLVQRFRRHFGDRVPISFSAGIDRRNFHCAVALGLVPVTVCTDLLKPGGYGRARGYLDELCLRMEEVGAASVDDFVLRAHGLAGEALERLDPVPDVRTRRECERALADGSDLRAAAGDELHSRWLSAAKLLNTEEHVPLATCDPRYRRERNATVPRKIGSELELFDCITCDKCVPVCPNDANFTFVLPRVEIPIEKLEGDGESWSLSVDGRIAIEQPHQIANYADLCNDCGNCDVFCPEDGGPHLVKPRFFGDLETWRRSRHLDGFFLERAPDGERLFGRFEGRELELETDGDSVRYAGEGFELRFDPRDPAGTARGSAAAAVDLSYARILLLVRDAVFCDNAVSYLNP